MTPGSRVPIRTCLGCRQRRPKSALLRLARTADGVMTVDPRAAVPGRGAYVCRDAACAERVLRGGRVEQALRAPCRVDATLVEQVRGAECSARR